MMNGVLVSSSPLPAFGGTPEPPPALWATSPKEPPPALRATSPKEPPPALRATSPKLASLEGEET